MKTKLFLLSLALFALHLGAGAQDTSIVFGSKFYISGKVAQGGTEIVYQWQRNGKDIAGATNIDYTTDSTLVPGFYTYVRKSVCAECSGRWQYSNPHTIRVICPDPVQPSLISGTGAANKTQCADSAYVYTVSAIAGYSFNWVVPSGWATAGSTSNTITVTTGGAPGKISVTPVQAGSGCLGKARDSTIAAVNKRPTLTLTTNNSTQSITTGNAIANIVYTRGGSTPSANSLTSNPSGLRYNTTTHTISDTTSKTGDYILTVSVAGCPDAKATGTITATACPATDHRVPATGNGGKCYRAIGDVFASAACPANYTKVRDQNVIATMPCPMNKNGTVYQIWTGTEAYLHNSVFFVDVPNCSGTGTHYGVSDPLWRGLATTLGSYSRTAPFSVDMTKTNPGLGNLCVRNY